MFQLGEHVMHPQEGVCKITDRITMDAREYYALSPLSDRKLKLYVPILSSKKIGVRVLASEAELRSLYQEAEQADTPWIADRNARFRLYDESVQNGDLLEILKLSKMLHARRKEKLLTGRDKSFLDCVSRCTLSEFNFVCSGIS